MRRTLVFMTVLALGVALGAAGATAAMEDYCVVPPYVIQNVPPNVMLLLDNSESMFKFAYAEEECPNTFTRSFTYSYSSPGYVPQDPEGFSVGDWAYFGHETDKLYFWGGATEDFNNGDYVYLLVYDYRFYDCSTFNDNDEGLDAPAYMEAHGLKPQWDCWNAAGGSGAYARYWRGVGSGDRLRIKSNGWKQINGKPYLTVELEDEDGNPAVIDEYMQILMIKADCAVVDNVISSSGDNFYDDWTPLDQSFDPEREYYGYFSPHHWYTYESQKFFVPSDPKTGSELSGARAKAGAEWDGNFMNWLTMRRVDVLRRAMTGGRVVAGGGALVAEPVDNNFHHGVYKRVENAEDYVSSTYIQNSSGFVMPGPRCFYFPKGGGEATFQVDTAVDGNCSDDSIDERTTPTDPTDDAPLGSSVYGPDIKLSGIKTLPGEEVEGVLQQIVGARARIGLMWFEDSINQGGVVDEPMGGQSLENVINAINNPINFKSGIKTPLSEALWTATGYFAGKGGFSYPLFLDNAGSGNVDANSTGPDYGSSYGNSSDPMNFGTKGSPRYPKCAKNYLLLVTDGSPCRDGKVPDVIRNFAKSGQDRSEFNCGKPYGDWWCAATSGSGYSFPGEYLIEMSDYQLSPWLECRWESGSTVAGLEDVALYAHITDLRNPEVGTEYMDGETVGENQRQNIDLYVVNAFGRDSNLLKYAAINGGFEELSDPPNDRPDLQAEWDADGDGEPDNYYSADDGADLERAIEEAFDSMLKRASSGTAASVLASGEDSGANLIQAIFYPRRRFGNEVIRWTGSLQSFWYYIDPYFVNNSIREDTDHDNKLHMTADNIAKLYFDDEAQAAKARLFSSNENGSPVAHIANVPIEDVDFIWEAGIKLFERDITAEPRKIYTPDFLNAYYDGYGTLRRSEFMDARGLKDFVASSSWDYWFFVGMPTMEELMDPMFNPAEFEAETNRVIRYLHGEDFSEDPVYGGIYRDRKVTIDGATGVWKLADVLNSTPQIAAREVEYEPDANNIMQPHLRRMPVGTDYSLDYLDKTFEAFLNTPGQDEMGTVFAGANDGMLHAFRLGNVGHDWEADAMDPQQPLEKARLTGSDLGEEAWAFIPMNALPYLKYFPLRDYCHIYTVDLSPELFDMSIAADPDIRDNYEVEKHFKDQYLATGQASYCNDTDYHNCVKSRDSWRTVLIGGMRFGGACKDNGQAGVSVEDPVYGIGYSSYFALDVTDPEDPKFLWEFANPGDMWPDLSVRLGFATSGPVVVKISGLVDNDEDGTPETTSDETNGRWYVIFGSGTTGPVETHDHQFMGESDQDLRYFVLDAKTGELVRVIDAGTDLGITEAFSSTLHAASADTDSDYSDDVVYLGYSRKDPDTNPNYTWTKGGVLRLITEEDLDPANWRLSEVIKDIGPVTATVQMLGTNEALSGEDQLWLYFGSGRYFYDTSSMHDDFESTRYLYGVRDNCFTGELFEKYGKGETPDKTFQKPCDTVISEPEGTLEPSTLGNADDGGVENENGWRITLSPYPAEPDDKADPNYGFAAERLITDPVASYTTSVVYFTTYRPYEMTCGLGGKSAVWAVDARTAGSVADRLKGKALVQVSTGVIEEIDLASAFSERGGRRSAMIEGVPPMAQGMSLFSQPAPIRRILHIIER